MRPDPFSWNPHPEALAAIAVLAAGYWALTRSQPLSRARLAAFAGAAALLVAVAVTPLDALTYHVLTAHLLQNVVLAEWAPALLVLALTPAAAARLSALPLLATLARPAVALPLWIAVYFAWHVPIAYDTALRHPNTLLHLEHASYLVAGVLFWWPALTDSPVQLSNGGRAAYVFTAFVFASPLGLLLALLPDSVYDFYRDGFSPWDLSALADQQLAGLTMVAEQSVVFFAAFTTFFFRFLADEERAGEPAGG